MTQVSSGAGGFHGDSPIYSSRATVFFLLGPQDVLRHKNRIKSRPLFDDASLSIFASPSNNANILVIFILVFLRDLEKTHVGNAPEC